MKYDALKSFHPEGGNTNIECTFCKKRKDCRSAHIWGNDTTCGGFEKRKLNIFERAKVFLKKPELLKIYDTL